MEGFIKVAAAIPSTRVADCQYNTQQIALQIGEAEEAQTDIIVFPELSITGYTCQDLFQQETLLQEAKKSLLELASKMEDCSITAVVGLPLYFDGMVLNCAAVLHKGKILGIVPKTYLPNYNEFYEARWFSSASRLHHDQTVTISSYNVPIGGHLLFELPHFTVGIEICEDLWATIAPGAIHTLNGADLILNLSASNEVIGKYAYLRSLVLGQSAKNIGGYVFSGSGYGESTQDVVFGGIGLIAEKGELLAEATRYSLQPQIIYGDIDIEAIRNERLTNTTFGSAKDLLRQSERLHTSYRRIVVSDKGKDNRTETTRRVNPLPFVPSDKNFQTDCSEVLTIQSFALARRLDHTHTKNVVIGISGGLDSTLALLVAVKAFDLLGLDRRGIVGITMPGFGTTSRTHDNAVTLMKELGITRREIDITAACEQHFKDIDHDTSKLDTTFENGQARERTQILMDVANQIGGFVVGTGDLSELALGWATYNGDHMSMYGVNAGIPKTLIRNLIQNVIENSANEAVRRTLLDILATPVSPELLPADAEGQISQKTEDLVGPYELHDFFLYHMLRNGFGPRKIYELAQRAFDGTDSRVSAFSKETILHWLTIFFRRFFTQQFKRSCLPDGPKVLPCSLSPRGDWRMPSDACATLWLNECAALQNE
ncbi:MAG: NAD(+) synthase [Alloprevotella sp.]|nr:NAD(+) synthase [Alloprevotella sp.]